MSRLSGRFRVPRSSHVIPFHNVNLTRFPSAHSASVQKCRLLLSAVEKRHNRCHLFSHIPYVQLTRLSSIPTPASQGILLQEGLIHPELGGEPQAQLLFSRERAKAQSPE